MPMPLASRFIKQIPSYFEIFPAASEETPKYVKRTYSIMQRKEFGSEWEKKKWTQTTRGYLIMRYRQSVFNMCKSSHVSC